MNWKAILMALLAATIALSGCSKDSGPEIEVVDDTPDEIDQQSVKDLEDEIVSKFPRRFSFPGQEAQESIRFYINETLDAGTGAASVEVPNDYSTGAKANTVIIPYDLDDKVPVGQPVEMRVTLKWWADPGSAAEMDIYVNVPGTHDSHETSGFDESFNWNIITKFRVVNTVRAEGQPFQIGIEVSNGRNPHPDGIDYSIQVDMAFPERVLAPGVAYAIDVPANASRLLFESEPVDGDEHITGEFMVIGPDDKLVRHFDYDDIGVDTRLVTVREAGEYIVYAPHLHGGFLKVSTDVPNEKFQARILQTTSEDVTLASGYLAPSGQSGDFTVDTFPLEMHAWIKPSAGAAVNANAALNLTGPGGWVTTVETTGNIQPGEDGRVGNQILHRYRNANLASGAWTWTVEGSASAGVDAGYTWITYTR